MMRVYIVDDDLAVRESLSQMLELLGHRTVIFSGAEEMLDACDPAWVGCVVADLRLPGMNGIELQAALARKGCSLPFIIITGHGDVPSAREAFQAKAIDFLEKPIDDTSLLSAIDSAMKLESKRVQENELRNEQAARIQALTQRERQVLQLVGRGLPAKEIAQELGISPRTVEIHKGRVMEKVRARNVSELVRLALLVERL